MFQGESWDSLSVLINQGVPISGCSLRHTSSAAYTVYYKYALHEYSVLQTRFVCWQDNSIATMV